MEKALKLIFRTPISPGGFGLLILAGTKASTQVRFFDNYYAFKTQLDAFVAYLRTGDRVIPWAETQELMNLVAGGILSREEGGRQVSLEELQV